MTPILSGLCWAAALILLALANRLGWIADKDATTMFVIWPALWVATGGLRNNCLRKSAA
jgi:hypothetical protein